MVLNLKHLSANMVMGSQAIMVLQGDVVDNSAIRENALNSVKNDGVDIPPPSCDEARVSI